MRWRKRPNCSVAMTSYPRDNDYIYLMEDTYPPDIVDIVNQRSTPFQNLPY
jgi:hypothetical protein